MLSQEDTFRTALVGIHGFLKSNERTMAMLYKLRGFVNWQLTFFHLLTQLFLG